MRLSEEKIIIIQKVISLNDEEKLDQIHDILVGENDSAVLSKAEMESIDRGLKDLDEGKKISYSEFKEKLEKWITT